MVVKTVWYWSEVKKKMNEIKTIWMRDLISCSYGIINYQKKEKTNNEQNWNDHFSIWEKKSMKYSPQYIQTKATE